VALGKSPDRRRRSVAVDVHGAAVFCVEVVIGVRDDREVRGVLGEHRPVAPVDDATVFGELAVEQLEVRGVVTEHAVALVDVLVILGETGAAEQFEGSGVGVGQRHTVDEDVGRVHAVGGVVRSEGRAL